MELHLVDGELTVSYTSGNNSTIRGHPLIVWSNKKQTSVLKWLDTNQSLQKNSLELTNK